jgi:hypothetical protein
MDCYISLGIVESIVRKPGDAPKIECEKINKSHKATQRQERKPPFFVNTRVESLAGSLARTQRGNIARPQLRRGLSKARGTPKLQVLWK